VTGDLTKCNSRNPIKDIWNMCLESKEACAMESLTKNLTGSLFVMMGKLTSLAETLKSFPAEDGDDYVE